jgi:hypothetical protein
VYVPACTVGTGKSPKGYPLFLKKIREGGLDNVIRETGQANQSPDQLMISIRPGPDDIPNEFLVRQGLKTEGTLKRERECDAPTLVWLCHEPGGISILPYVRPSADRKSKNKSQVTAQHIQTVCIGNPKVHAIFQELPAEIKPSSAYLFRRV